MSGKDIAYQLWKFGLLGKDFYYRPMQTYADGRVLCGSPPTSRTRIGPAVRARTARVQRDRHAAVVSAGRGGGGAARARVYASRRTARSTSPTRWSRCRRAAAPIWASALGRGPQAAVRRSVRPKRARRQGRRSDGQADRQGAGRGGIAARREPDEENRTRRYADCHRRAALFPAEIHAQYGDRVRSPGSAELRRRDRAVRAVRGGARAQDSGEAARRRGERFRISRPS